MTKLFARRTHNDASAAGPGSYDIPAHFGNESPRYKIKGRYEMKNKEVTPGPYSINTNDSGAPKYTIGSRPQNRDVGSLPGPDYIPPSFGSDSQKTGIHGTGKVVSAKPATDIGPAGYDIKPVFGNSAPKYTIAHRENSNLNRGVEDTPGPAAYNSPDMGKTTSRAYSIGVRSSTTKVDVTPGPADYADRPTDKRGIAFHIKPPEKEPELSPGPAAYVPPINFGTTSPAFKIGNRPAPKTTRSMGEYVALKSTIGQGTAHRIGDRPRERQAAASPGPYQAPPTFGSDSVKPTIGRRLNDPLARGRTQSPGPAFDTSRPLGSDAPRPSIKGKNGPDWMKAGDGPGPAAYMPEAPKSARGCSIGVRYPERKIDGDGSGFIAAPQPKRGPAYTIGRRESCDLVPI